VRAASAPIRAAIFTNIAVFGALAAACSGASSGKLVGVSDAVPERVPRAAPEAPRAAWADFAAARAWPEAAPPVIARVHRRDGSLVHVRVEPQGLAAYRDLAVDSPMPSEARVIAWHETSAGELLGGYLLEKRAGAWAAREIDASGGLVPGDGAACLRCHAMAPTDHLFGVGPRPAAPAPGGESKAPAPR